MSELLAHMRLFGRHHKSVFVGGYYWRYCSHIAHGTGRHCWRWHNSDGYCAEHNRSCYSRCEDA